ncbi:hypothetical protein K8Z61_03060 [Nocardioides sp. TRM66260-LWL]|uniref:hypothetical protein n=1 Tax=Nocardioides sp. TRM66260-LWL TaxID=2874478 RepID=UPI001CC59115|nr:hypothetical protein [Nocardioides sp. TRM66260-LWL]MBZ5733465.1 hypothetical protein [Nocardioides sp. TRM66260-LWL]
MRISKRARIAVASISTAAVLGGGALAYAGTASAADGSGTTPATPSATATPPAPPAGAPDGPGRPGGPGGPGAEKPLTGETKTKVEDAVKAKYPDATIERTETDAGGVYEAHIVTKDGTHLVVKVGKDFTITGTETPPAPPKGAKPPTPPAPAAPSASSSASPSSTIAS